MSIKKTSLKSGVTIITEDIPGYSSATVGIHLDTGSRDEKAHKAGISHFYEHMVFKGTETRSAFEITDSIESLGGDINAFTSKEEIYLVAKVTPSHVLSALEVLCDMAENPSLTKEDFNSEKMVVLEEIAESSSSYDNVSYDLFFKSLWSKDPLGAPILGTAGSVKSITHKDMLDFHEHVKKNINLTISVAGRVDHKEIVKAAKALLKSNRGYQSTHESTHESRSLIGSSPTRHLTKTDHANQCYITASVSLEDYDCSDILATKLVSEVFGGGMSSRLFMKIREEEGLVYYVGTEVANYDNVSGFIIHMIVDPSNANKALKLMEEECKKLRDFGLTKSEILKAKNQVASQSLFGLESTGKRMQTLVNGLRGLKDLTNERKIRGITPTMINEAIATLFSVKWSSSIVLPEGVDKKDIKVKPYLKW